MERDKQEPSSEKEYNPPFFVVVSPSNVQVMARIRKLSGKYLEIPLKDVNNPAVGSFNLNSVYGDPNAEIHIDEAFAKLGTHGLMKISELNTGDLECNSYLWNVDGYRFSLGISIAGKEFIDDVSLMRALAGHGWIIKPPTAQ